MKIAIIIISVVVLVMVGAALVWFQTTRTNQNLTSSGQQTEEPRKVNDVDYSPPTDEDKKQQDQQKDDIIQNADNGSTEPSSVSVSISRASQAGPGQPLNIRAIVDGATSGMCDVTLTKDGGNTIKASFAITPDATYGACTNPTIPASEFSTGGAWKVQVVAKSGSVTSQPATLTVNIAK